jgi:hypothetical protein
VLVTPYRAPSSLPSPPQLHTYHAVVDVAGSDSLLLAGALAHHCWLIIAGDGNNGGAEALNESVWLQWWPGGNSDAAKVWGGNSNDGGSGGRW